MVTKGVRVCLSFTNLPLRGLILYDIPQYNLFYTTNVAMNIPILVLIFIAFRQLRALPPHPTEQVISASEQGPTFKDVLKHRAVWSLSIFLMLYVG